MAVRCRVTVSSKKKPRVEHCPQAPQQQCQRSGKRRAFLFLSIYLFIILTFKDLGFLGLDKFYV
ncbi:uncharacterized protein DS421_11g322280 [Arachis hypogaea]|nr:uncharacterized protein DS421_11g322280 [Arachis hypogaea]